MFFAEKSGDGDVVDYAECLRGGLRIVPEGEAREILADDYAKMVEDGILLQTPVGFDALMAECASVEQGLNKALSLSPPA
jgi:hypothetical protein